jgi:hypothetical protein
MSKRKCICEQDPVVIFRNCFESIDFSCIFLLLFAVFMVLNSIVVLIENGQIFVVPQLHSVNDVSKHQWLLIYVWFLCYLCNTCFLWPPRMSTHFSGFRYTEVRTISKIPSFTRNFLWTLFTFCCNTSKYTKVSRCPHSQKSSERERPAYWAPTPNPLSTESVFQMPPGNAEKMRCWHIVRASLVFSLMKRNIFQKYSKSLNTKLALAHCTC